jgi:hypothetical protein
LGICQKLNDLADNDILLFTLDEDNNIPCQDHNLSGAQSCKDEQPFVEPTKNLVDEDDFNNDLVKSEIQQRHQSDRHDWTPIRAIPDDRFKRLALLFIDINGWLEEEDCNVLARFEGGYHHVVMLRVYDGDGDVDYVIKVPAVGTDARWSEADAHNMASEASLMRHLSQHTNIPVPEIVASDETLDNILGAPFMLMKKMPGEPSYKVWFEDHKDRDHITECEISQETEAKRVTMLRSLAQVMAQLQAFQFDKIGLPDFYKVNAQGGTHVTSWYRWKTPIELENSNLHPDDQLYPVGPFQASIEYMTAKLDTSWPTDPTSEDLHHYDRLINIGTRKVLDIIYSNPIIARSTSKPTFINQQETFVLRHPDLDFQNILVDPAGNVTGLLDWDGCITVPRCVGYATVPDFLRGDWSSDFSLFEPPHLSWQLEHYRQIYTDAMLDTACPEAKYTAKSAMYRAIVEALDTGDADDVVRKVLREISGLRRASLNQILMLIGRGTWDKGEEYLKTEIGKLLEPEVIKR